jgi:hypothetical protein
MYELIVNAGHTELNFPLQADLVQVAIGPNKDPLGSGSSQTICITEGYHILID